MSAIKNNPYRVLGILGNSKEKELQRQLAKLKAFTSVGKTVSFEYDFDFLGGFERGGDEILKAANKIDQLKNKIHYAMFWFINVNNIDEVALNHLKNSNVQKAIEIWEATLAEKSITTKNFSALQNLTTLQLGLSANNGSIEVEKFVKNIELKGNILKREILEKFTELIIGENAAIDYDILVKDIIDELLELLKPLQETKSSVITIKKIIESFKNYPAEIKKYVLEKYINKPISEIELAIEKAKKSREENSFNGDKYGERLFKDTKANLVLLKELLGENDFKYEMITSNVADEMYQCAIDYFNANDEDKVSYLGENVLKILKYARSIVKTGQVRNRIDDNIEKANEWLRNKPFREKMKKIENYVELIMTEINKLEERENTIASAKKLVEDCKPHLEVIAFVLKADDEIYLQLSSRILHEAMEMVVDIINREINYVKTNYYGMATQALKLSVARGLTVLVMLRKMECVPELKQRLEENIKGVKEINDMINVTVRSSNSGYSQKTTNNIGYRQTEPISSGCYLATMVYGSYEHEQVMILRKFRDEKLLKSEIGKIFVRTYYKISPMIVIVLQDKRRINNLIKIILDKLISVVK
jgi:hypothetical protein